jgi:hypothetical protein
MLLNGAQTVCQQHPPDGTRKVSESILMGYVDVFNEFGIAINTQKDWRAKGKGGPRSAVIAGKVKYRRADVLAWLDEQFDKTAKGSAKPAPTFSPLGKRSLVNAAC